METQGNINCFQEEVEKDYFHQNYLLEPNKNKDNKTAKNKTIKQLATARNKSKTRPLFGKKYLKKITLKVRLDRIKWTNVYTGWKLEKLEQTRCYRTQSANVHEKEYLSHFMKIC